MVKRLQEKYAKIVLNSLIKLTVMVIILWQSFRVRNYLKIQQIENQ